MKISWVKLFSPMTQLKNCRGNLEANLKKVPEKLGRQCRFTQVMMALKILKILITNLLKMAHKTSKKDCPQKKGQKVKQMTLQLLEVLNLMCFRKSSH